MRLIFTRDAMDFKISSGWNYRFLCKWVTNLLTLNRHQLYIFIDNFNLSFSIAGIIAHQIYRMRGIDQPKISIKIVFAWFIPLSVEAELPRLTGINHRYSCHSIAYTPTVNQYVGTKLLMTNVSIFSTVQACVIVSCYTLLLKSQNLNTSKLGGLNYSLKIEFLSSNCNF